MDLSSSDYRLILRVIEALHSSLDLRVVLDQAAPPLLELMRVDRIALAVSRPGTLDDYEWFSNALPEKLIPLCGPLAGGTEPTLLCTFSRHAGAGPEQVMTMMLLRERELRCGLSLYRSSPQPFSERDAHIVRVLAPHAANAVRNSREHAERQREALLEPVFKHTGLAVLWLDAELHEITRTPVASGLIERYFSARERKQSALPEAILTPLREYFRSDSPDRPLPEAARDQPLSSLRLKYVPLPERGVWAVVMSTIGIDCPLALEQELPPRLLEIAASLVRGLSNEQIAQQGHTKLSTVKQQVSDIYRRLGVRGRKGLIQLASGLASADYQVVA